MSVAANIAWDELLQDTQCDYAMEHIMQRPPVEIGIRAVDDALGGGMPVGTFTVLAGEGGTGKSAMACVAQYTAATNGRRPVYYSIEMPRHLVISRLLSVHARKRGLPPVWWSTTRNEVMRLAGHYVTDPSEAAYYAQRFMCGDADGRVDHVLAAWDDFERTIWRRMAIIDDKHSIAQVCASIDSLCSAGLRILPIIDYVQLGADGEGTEYERVTDASHLLQQTTKRWQIPMLALSSLRNIRKEERDQPPNVSQLRGSGHLGYDAGTVMVLRRADSQTHGSEKGITAYVVKNRVGPINEDGIPLLFNGGANQFT